MARTLARERPDREEVLWPVQKACPACGHLEHDRVRLTRSCSCFLLERAIHARCRRADARQPQTIALYCASYVRPPAAVTLDIDDTPDIVHGHQQLALFNSHYGE